MFIARHVAVPGMPPSIMRVSQPSGEGANTRSTDTAAAAVRGGLIMHVAMTEKPVHLGADQRQGLFQSAEDE